MSHNFRLPVGKYKGELITRVPVNYLRWMTNGRHALAKYAQAELDRRGVSECHPIDISSHAIDRASQRLMHHWMSSAEDGDGIYTWLMKSACEALYEVTECDRIGSKRVERSGVVYVFEFSTVQPVLKSVWLSGESE